MLRIESASLRRGNKLLFEEVSAQLHPGQRVGLIGINGSGKSSLFAAILGELEPDSGDIHLPPDGQIAHVAQQSPNSNNSALDFVLDGDSELRELQQKLVRLESAADTPETQHQLHEVHDRLELINGYTAEPRGARLLSGLGFGPGEETRAVNEFSGGWRMRLNLAQALMCRSDILLLDEPTNHLDLPAILWLERWLQAYEGIAVIISHDRDFLDSLCTHILHIEHQTITSYTGNYSQFEHVRSERLALQQSMHEKQQREISHIQKYVDRFRYKASKARQAQSRLKMLERMTVIAPAHVDSQFHFSFLEPEQLPHHLLSLDRVTCGYEQPVVSNVTFSIGSGSRIGLLGVNGAGKSTLIKTLVNGGTLLNGERTQHRHTRIGYFAQHQLDQLQLDCSPMWHMRQQDGEHTEQALRNHLGRFGFQGDRVEENVEPFSGGEKARLVLAMIVLQKPNLLLLDEPTNHLDLEMRQALSMALASFEGALLVISHDRHLVRSACDELFIVHDGALVEFPQALDDYPSWLRDQESGRQPANAARKPSEGKKEARKREAQRRQALQPHRKKVKNIETALAKRQEELKALKEQLSEEALYTDPERRTEVEQLTTQQNALNKEVETLEWDWLEAADALANAEQELDAESA